MLIIRVILSLQGELILMFDGVRAYLLDNISKKDRSFIKS